MSLSSIMIGDNDTFGLEPDPSTCVDAESRVEGFFFSRVKKKTRKGIHDWDGYRNGDGLDRTGAVGA